MNSSHSPSGAKANGVIIASAEPFQLDTAQYPWLQEPRIEVPVVSVYTQDGTAFQYGSLIGFSNAVRKIADNVSKADSASSQAHLFTAVPDILQGNRHPGIGKVENARSQDQLLLSASRNITRAVRLIFTVEQPEASAGVPTVLKAGISNPNDHGKLVKSLGVKAIGGGGPKKMRRS